jgi:hypothetical protein
MNRSGLLVWFIGMLVAAHEWYRLGRVPVHQDGHLGRPSSWAERRAIHLRMIGACKGVSPEHHLRFA